MHAGGAHHGEGVAQAVLLLEVERAARRRKPPAREDDDAVAQRVGLLHAVRGEHHGAAAHLAADDVPREAPRRGVHAARRLVQELQRMLACACAPFGPIYRSSTIYWAA